MVRADDGRVAADGHRDTVLVIVPGVGGLGLGDLLPLPAADGMQVGGPLAVVLACAVFAVGPGVRLRKKYERRARRNGLTDIIFTGYTTYDNLPRYYQTADIVCFPATGQESFGIVLLEAMSVGKPIVASAIDGYASVLTDGAEGLAVPPRNAEKLAEAIIRLLHDKVLRREMGARGKLKVPEYDWSHLSQKVLDFYTETLNRLKDREGEIP